MPVLLSDEEMEALSGLPHMHHVLYIMGIRRYMDYKTGIVGIKRKISLQSLVEEIFIEPRVGTKIVNIKSKFQIHRALKILEKAGLISFKSVSTKDKKQLILKCILAKTDESGKNKAATPPQQSLERKAAAAEYKENTINIDIKDKSKEESRTVSRNTLKNEAAIPPVFGLNIKKNNTTCRVFLLLTQEIGFSETMATKLLEKHAEKYISEKLELVMGSDSYKQGKIKNMPAYLQKAIADDFKHAQSIKNQPDRVGRGDIKGSDCKALGCERKGVKSFTIGTRWYWFCDEHLKIEQDRAEQYERERRKNA